MAILMSKFRTFFSVAMGLIIANTRSMSALLYQFWFYILTLVYGYAQVA